MGEKIYTVEDVMELLAIARRTVYHAIRDGELVGVKVAGRWQFTEQQVKDYIQGINR